MKNAQFILIDTTNNHNRVYNMTQNGSKIIVEMGRQGATLMKKSYPMSFWDELYNKKLAEGYIDRSAEFNLSSEIENLQYKQLDDSEIQAFVDYFISCSRNVVQKNISISYEQVSEKMIEEAQKAIYNASNEKSLKEICSILENLFRIIPRKMKNVADYLPKDMNEVSNVLEREQGLLDALKTVKNTKAVQPKETILEAYHLDVKRVSSEEEYQIKKHLDSYTAQYFKRAYKVNNKNTEVKFKHYMDKNGLDDNNIHFYYHGSSDANYWGIITEGLSINPKAPVTGKMFGYGIYFAPKARKSLGYTDLSGSYWRHGHCNKAYLAVFKVCYGKPKHVDSCDGFHGLRKLSGGYDAAYAHAGRQLKNDEVIIYTECQCTIQYMIELEM